MKTLFQIAILALCLAMPVSASAQSKCYVDYKAKRSTAGALELHYGVMQLGQNACANKNQRDRVVQARIAQGGWDLLRVMSTFDASGLQKRRGNAGSFFLKY